MGQAARESQNCCELDLDTQHAHHIDDSDSVFDQRILHSLAEPRRQRVCRESQVYDPARTSLQNL